MKRLITLLLILSGIVFADAGYHQNRILFCLKNEVPHLQISMRQGIAQTDIPALNAILQKYEVTELRKWLRSADDSDVVGEINLNKVYRATFVAKRSWDELQGLRVEFANIAELHSADLESVNRLHATTPQVDVYTPDDTRYSEQWNITKIQADAAWGLWGTNTPGDPDILVGVVDTGVDTEHPDLQGVLYLNPGEDLNSNGVVDPSDENGVDDDGNGYTDDFYGYDFADNDNNIRPPDAGPDQELSHGTHCAGIIGATTNNATGVAGISFRSKVIASKHARDSDTTNPGIVDGYDGILYAAKLGAKFINCSWGGSFLFSYERDILDEVADTYGAIVVSSAGNEDVDNDTNASYPANYSNVISVAATTNNDVKAYYSNWGSNVDISAPAGEGSISSTATLSTIHDNAGSYAAWQGTSMASPMVAGALALLNAWYPSASRQWLFDEILEHADPIDDENPDYAGELGGRLNIYNAIGRNAFPYLEISKFSYSVVGGNGDGQLNPGESANLVLTIKNDPLWLDAQNTTVTLSSSSSYITFSDDNASLGTIVAGDSATNVSGDLVFDISADASLEVFPITVTMQANAAAANPYTFSKDIEVRVSMNLAGFPVLEGSEVLLPVAVDSLFGTSAKQIITIADNDSLYVFNADGSLASGFPIEVGYSSGAPIIADMNANGQKEIVVVNRSGKVWVIGNDGTIIVENAIGEQVQDHASVANMDGDAELEIVFGTMTRNLHVLNLDGSEVGNFPLNHPSPIKYGPALADISGDATPEIIFGLFNGQLHAITTTLDTLDNFPLTLDSKIMSKPVVAKITTQSTEDHYILVTTDLDNLVRVDLNGNADILYESPAVIDAELSLADLNNDDQLDVSYGALNGKLYAFDILSGDSLSNFPLSLQGEIKSSPVYADFDNDGTLELSVSSQDGYLYLMDEDGSAYQNMPAWFDGHLESSSSIADMDNDGDLDIITAGFNGLQVVDAGGSTGSIKLWDTFQANSHRTNYYQFTAGASAVTYGETIPEIFALHQNYPNPFNPVTTINYSIADNSVVELAVYDVLGQKVATLYEGLKSAGNYSLKWNGKNSAGQSLSSGLYFYKLSVENSGTTFVKKMLLVR